MVIPKKARPEAIADLYEATAQAIEDVQEAQHRKRSFEYKLKRRLMQDGWDMCLTVNMRAVKRGLKS